MERKAVVDLAERLIREHGLSDLGWTFAWSNHKTTLGWCVYANKEIHLSLPTVLIADENFIREVMLHEIAHAKTEGHHHDRVWKEMAISLGGSGKTSPPNIPVLPGPWKGVCPVGHIHYMYRRPRKVALCLLCGPYDTKNLIRWSYKGDSNPQMSEQYQAEWASFLDNQSSIC